MINPSVSLEDLQKLGLGNMGEHLSIEFTEIGSDYVCGKMPVDHRTRQPFGILHGGASVVLAETLGSIAASCCIDITTKLCVGLDINANHVRAVKEGYVYGKATALHIGKTTHVWEIRITNEAGQLVCISRITMAIIDRK